MKVRYLTPTQLTFECPGCDSLHVVNIQPPGPVWSFNGDSDKPTLSPSIRVTWPANPNATEEFKEWRTERVCHSFVKDGMIQFLSDCYHPLAGKTVELPEIEL